MKIAVAASPEAAIPTLDWLSESESQFDLVISRPDSLIGRGRELKPTPVSEWAIKNSYELYRPAKALDFDERLKDYDLVITIGYGLILPQYLLDQPRQGFINLHFSLLPELRGAAPAQRAIINGLTETGVTVFKLDSGMDTGPIYLQQRYSIQNGQTAGELLMALAALGPFAISDTLTLIKEGFTPIPQVSGNFSIAQKLSKEEAIIDWNENAERNIAKILGFSPNPGAITNFRSENLRILRAGATSKVLAAGEISLENGRVYIGTSTSAIEILEVTPAGKRRMSAAAWANGARFVPGERVE